MFAKTFLAAAVTCGLLAPTVNGHMVIRQPVPYGQDTLTNSPLENDGSDFPCKQRSGVYDITKMNTMPVGVPQDLAFTGGATHGGGSCQVSVTLDKEPTKDSEWKVIQSIIGGCPANSTGNLSDDAAGTDASVFQFSIPKGMPNGQYTLAWTWFNKIGNREMYMNCAPITVTGGADNNDVYNTLPDMFVINIPNEECSTTEGEDFVFPNPGLYVETAFRTALGSSTAGSNCAAVTMKGAGAGKAGSVAQPTGYGGSSAGSSIAASSAAPTSQAPSYTAPYVAQTTMPVAVTSSAASQGSDGMVSVYNIVTYTSMVTVTADGPPPTEQTQASSPNYGSPDTSDTSSTSDSNGTASTGSCTSGSVACDTDGSIVCIGSDQWGTCNAGCAFPMALAGGTSCSGGVISKRHVYLGSMHMDKHIRRAHRF